MSTKLRLVRCPKCQLLLPELPHFPVYKCGGCGALLQAKKTNPSLPTPAPAPAPAPLNNWEQATDEHQLPSISSQHTVVPSIDMNQNHSHNPPEAVVIVDEHDHNTSNFTPTAVTETSLSDVAHHNDALEPSGKDPMQSTEMVDQSPDPNFELKAISKSPTSTSFYAYDASVSSFGATDDQLPDPDDHHFLLPSKRIPFKTRKVAEFAAADQRLRRHKFPANTSLMRTEREENGMPADPFSIPSNKRHYSTKYINRNHDKQIEPTSLNFPVRNQMTTEREENGMPGYSERKKVELLRMIYEIKDQLDRTHLDEQKANARRSDVASWKEKNIPLCCEHKDEIYQDFNCPGYPHQSKFLQGATHTKHDMNYSCLHYNPHMVCCNRGLCMVPKYCNCHSSTPTTPRVYLNRGRDAKSDDQRHHKEHDARKTYLRERHQLVKRHLRPTANGAPFITCRRCMKLLQLPGDFLVFRRRCHRLRCGACSEVLKFSLQNKAHLAHYTPNTINPPPPSEADNSGYNDVVDAKNMASSCLPNNCTHGDPVSFSEDFGPSFCKSCSTAAGNSYELVSRECRNKYKNPLQGYDFPGPSSNTFEAENMSTKIEEIQPTLGSPLHRLMGYSSASELIYDSPEIRSYYPEKNLRWRN